MRWKLSSNRTSTLENAMNMREVLNRHLRESWHKCEEKGECLKQAGVDIDTRSVRNVKLMSCNTLYQLAVIQDDEIVALREQVGLFKDDYECEKQEKLRLEREVTRLQQTLRSQEANRGVSRIQVCQLTNSYIVGT